MSRLFTAYHEAGHCIASHLLGCRPSLITIDEQPRVEHENWNDAEATAMMIYAASVAATRAGAPSSLRGSMDLEMLGQVTSKLPPEIADAIPSRAQAFVANNWAKIEELVRVLLIRRTLQGDDLEQELARIVSLPL
jgi:hypothetical protein